MNRLLRLYNQNKALVIVIAIVIALIIIVIQILNGIIGNQKESSKNNENKVTNTNVAISESDKSVITGEKVDNNDEKIDTIKEFVNYCNDGDIEHAYNMLTEDCKETIFPSIDDFRERYYNRIFYINRMYKLENWFANNNLYTYYIKYTEDVLASGNVNSKDNIGDYITVIKVNGKNYLNINNYVGAISLNNKQSNEGVDITVSKIHMYIDYTILDIKLKNNTKNTVCIDTKENLKTAYLYDLNDVKYQAFLNEIVDEQLVLKNGVGTNIKIKFNKMYNPDSRELRGVVFSDIVLNYEEYMQKTEEKESISIDIKL